MSWTYDEDATALVHRDGHSETRIKLRQSDLDFFVELPEKLPREDVSIEGGPL